ncbi:hypothetical protein GCM10027037_12570 [Mucilaginibacter koreensis]
MKIINNNPGPNHLSNLIACFENADEIIIVSPFISADITFFPFEKLSFLKKVTLITRLKSFTNDQYEKISFFLSLINYCKQKNIQLKILIDNILHGKVYIGAENGNLKEAVITSANFNKFGLEYNNEWGVWISEENLIKQIYQGILDRIVLEPITENDVERLSKELHKQPTKKKERETDLDLAKHLKKRVNPLNIQGNTTYWLKPIGVSGDYVPWGKAFSSLQTDLHFAKSPKGVHPGHIIITYAVGHRNILSIYKVISETKLSGINRWPYLVVGENLSPYYGDQWHLHSLTITNQKDEVLGNNLFNITPSGKNSYGSLMRSADKLKITSDFGEFIVNKIQSLDQKIAEAQQ